MKDEQHIHPDGDARPVAVPGTYLFTAVRNEAPFLIEWIAYHKVIGFENVLIFANPSTDGTDELLAALADAGEITFVAHNPREGVGPQRAAARLANQRGYIPDGAWVSWLDADEFLNVKCGSRRLESLIEEMGERICMLIPWRIFGDGGNDSFEGRHLSEKFVSASSVEFPDNREVKSFFKKGGGVLGFARRGINRPLLSAHSCMPDSVVTGLGTPIHGTDQNRQWLAGKDDPGTRLISEAEHGYSIAQINHYSVRTPEHYLLKRVRGRGYTGNSQGEANTRHTPNSFHHLNRNECEDRSILRWEAATGHEMARLLAIPSVQAAHEAAMEKVRAEIARLPAEELAELRSPPPGTAASAPAPESHGDFKLKLPPDEARAVRDTYSRAQVILEYGSGGSTFVGVESGAQFVMSVESDRDWAQRIATSLEARFAADRFLIHHADIGPTKAWGQPADRSGFRRYPLYAAEIWDHPQFRHPDVVLIDGRFRVACFLATMTRITRPVTVLIDDYVDRTHYHWVEELCPRDRMIGRMAQFTVFPRALPPEYLTRFVAAFTDPR